MIKRKTTEEFIEDARKIHGDRYDYSQVQYENSRNKVTICCRIHGNFLQSPQSHLSGQGCPVSKGGVRMTQEEFLEAVKSVHGDKYNLNKVVYVNSHAKVTVTCPEHGDFEVLANNFVRGHGCPACAHYRTARAERFFRIEFVHRAVEIHEGKYDYSKVYYTGAHDKVTITCPVHGDFQQRAYHHLAGHGCPECAREARFKRLK